MFKNLAILIAIIMFGLCFYALYADKPPVFKGYAEEYEIYLSAGSFGDNIVRTTEKNLNAFAAVKGESCYLNGSYEQVLKDFSATHLFSEETEEGTSYYAYSPKIRYKTYIKGKAVNIHYFKGYGRQIVGTPMIFGSF
ncbi:MAG: hypothetical protein IJQ23_08545 [Clostridia bacterium]|nr:hypothetical protein [Clostridia bacterium]